MKSHARLHPIFRDTSANIRWYERRENQRFNLGQGGSLPQISRPNMMPITQRHELSYPFKARGVEVVYTTDVFEAEKWLRAHIVDCSAVAVGFDIEWKPQFVSKKKGGIENETAVLQLAVGTSSLVLHIYYMGKLPESLASILADENILKVGSAIKEDGLKLERHRGLVVKGLADIQLMAKQMCPALQKIGMKALADRFLGIKLDKKQATSNWEGFPLKSRQIEYAALDAWVGLEIFREMKRLKNQESNMSAEQTCSSQY